MPVEVMIVILIVALFVWGTIGVVLVLYVNMLAKRQQKQSSRQPQYRQLHFKHKSQYPMQNMQKSKRATSSATPASTVNAATQKRLSRLCNHDSAIVERLINDIQTRYPGKSPQWCWEKAIFDLERDRF
ncbi:MAG: hypothetical protein AAGA75_28180 [Cyanobacteria bacterium P01_E01_bin.6]